MDPEERWFSLKINHQEKKIKNKKMNQSGESYDTIASFQRKKDDSDVAIGVN